MELSDEKVLESLLHEWERQQLVRKPGPKGPKKAAKLSEASGPSVRRKTVRHCRCGLCAKCLENARWERIFQDKFADNDYYARRSVPLASPLSDL